MDKPCAVFGEVNDQVDAPVLHEPEMQETKSKKGKAEMLGKSKPTHVLFNIPSAQVIFVLGRQFSPSLKFGPKALKHLEATCLQAPSRFSILRANSKRQKHSGGLKSTADVLSSPDLSCPFFQAPGFTSCAATANTAADKANPQDQGA